MKHLYRIFIILSVTFLSALLVIAYAIKPSSDNKGVNKLKKESEEDAFLSNKDNADVKVFDGDNPLRILVLGVDKSATLDASEEQNGMRTDTMMLFTIDPKHNKVQLVSIPRDSYVRIHGYDKNKINSAFNDKVYPGGGLDLTVSTVEDLFDVKIDHYGIVDYKAVIGIVDAVGGMDVYWDQDDYHYEDNWVVPPLVVDLKRGENHLDGEGAVAYLRTRKAYANQDIGRIGAQQEFLLDLFDKLQSPSILFKVPKLLNIVDEYVETDLNYGEITKLAYYGLTLNRDDIHTATVDGYAKMMKQGKYDLSFYIVDPAKAQEIVHGFPENVMTEEEKQELLNDSTNVTTEKSVDEIKKELTEKKKAEEKKNAEEKKKQEELNNNKNIKSKK